MKQGGDRSQWNNELLIVGSWGSVPLQPSDKPSRTPFRIIPLEDRRVGHIPSTPAPIALSTPRLPTGSWGAQQPSQSSMRKGDSRTCAWGRTWTGNCPVQLCWNQVSWRTHGKCLLCYLQIFLIFQLTLWECWPLKEVMSYTVIWRKSRS